MVLPNLAATLPGLLMPPPAAKPPAIPLALPPMNHQSTNTAASAATAPFYLSQQAVEGHTNQLRESYLRALHQMHHQQGQQQQQVSSQSQPAAAAQQQINGQQPAPTLSHRTDTKPNSQPSSVKAPVATKLEPSSGAVTAPSPAAAPAAESTSTTTNDVPFVSSRSFDDFHRLLGKDVTLFASTKSNKWNQPQPSNSKEKASSAPEAEAPMNETNALFTAESYALLAQESATAASQHAAYHLAPAMMPAVPAAHLDMDVMLKQILSSTSGYGSTSTIRSSPDPEQGTATAESTNSKKPETAPSAAVPLQQQPTTTKPAPQDLPSKKRRSNSSNHTGRVSQTTTTPIKELTPVERFVGVSANMVSSGSEPSGDSASSASGGGRGGSFRGGSSNGSDNNTASGGSSLDNASSNESEEDGNSSSNSDSNSVEEGPRRKKAKLLLDNQHPEEGGKKTMTANYKRDR